MSDRPSHLNRRQVLRLAGIGLTGGGLISLINACAPGSPAAPTSAPAAPAPAPTNAPPKPAAPTQAAQAPQPTQAAPGVAKPSSNSSITVVQSADVPNLDPSRNNVIHVFNVADNVLDTPTYLDRTLKVQPRLATSWTAKDETTWEVKFRSGVKFHDGTPFDTSAVKANFEYQSASDAPSRSFFSNWDSLDIVDATTVTVKTKSPEPFFPNVLSRLWILSPSDIKSPTVFGSKMNGTGPFKLSEYTQGQQIAITPNGDYWGGAPKIGSVVYKAAPEASARTAMLQAGQADVVVNLPVEQAKQIESSGQLRLAAVPGLRAVPLMIDQRSGVPLTDLRVRQAMNHAVDKDAIIKNILGGYAQQQPATISPLIEGNAPDLKPYAYDPDRAKQLLSEAGYGSGFEIDFHHPTGRWMKDAEVAQAIAQMLNKVGIKANLLTAEYSTFFGTWSKGDYRGMTMIGVTNPDGAPNSLFNLFLYSKGSWPFSWTDAKLDTLIERARSTMDQTSRVAAYRELEQYVHDNAPWVFLWEQKDLYGINKSLKWEPSSNEIMHFWDASY